LIVGCKEFQATIRAGAYVLFCGRKRYLVAICVFGKHGGLNLLPDALKFGPVVYISSNREPNKVEQDSTLSVHLFTECVPTST